MKYTNKCCICEKEIKTNIKTKIICSNYCKKVRISQQAGEKYYKRKMTEIFKKKCKVCKEDFETYYEKQIYCGSQCRSEKLKKTSREIYTKKEIKKEISNCKNCNKPFEKKNYSQKYCTVECRENYYKELYENLIEVNCVTCGCKFKRKINSVLKHCSDKCKNIKKNKEKSENKKTIDADSLKGLITFKVENMLNKARTTKPKSCFGVTISEFVISGFTEKIKEEVRNRDDNECQICCDNECELEVHHILKRTLGGSNDLDNLVTLCVNCHRAIETNDLEHAIKSCYKKASKVNGRSLGGKLTIKEKNISLRFCLEETFKKISNEKGYEKEEILLFLDKVLMETS